MGCGSSAISKERFKLSESSFVTLKALAKRFDLKRSELEKFRVAFAGVRAPRLLPASHNDADPPPSPAMRRLTALWSSSKALG